MAHVVAVVRRDPHEAGRRRRVEIVDESAVRHAPTATRIREHDLRATAGVVSDVLERDEPVMLVGIRLGAPRDAACCDALTFHVTLPC